MKIRLSYTVIAVLLIGVFIGLRIGITTYSFLYPAFIQPNSTPAYDPFEKYDNAEKIVYSGEILGLIEKLKVEYGIEVLSPTLDPQSGVRNLPWSYGDLAIVYNKLAIMPKEFLSSAKSPTVIYLMKPEGTTGGPGGLYFDRHVWIFIPADFSYVAVVPKEKVIVFDSASSELGASVLHEYAHSYGNSDFEILLRFFEQTDWVFENDSFLYKGEQRKFNVGNDGSVSPSEDFAYAVGMAGYDPSYLTEAQLKFFVNYEPFSKWPSYVKWIKTFRPDLLKHD